MNSNMSSFNTDTNTLKTLCKNHVKTKENISLKISTYYKPQKLSSCFPIRPAKPTNLRSNVVYQFQCPEDNCQASYIGYTTNSLMTRCKQHRYCPSNIKSHYFFDHQNSPVPATDLLINLLKIIFSSNKVIDLKIAESLAIKNNRPIINVNYNEGNNILNLF